MKNGEDETFRNNLIENRKLNGEKRNKWREIRQARCARLAPSAPAAHRILMRCSKSSARSTSRASALSQRCRGLRPRRRLRRRCNFYQHASLSPFCSKPCASARSQRCCGLRPQHYRVFGTVFLTLCVAWLFTTALANDAEQRAGWLVTKPGFG